MDQIIVRLSPLYWYKVCTLCELNIDLLPDMKYTTLSSTSMLRRLCILYNNLVIQLLVRSPLLTSHKWRELVPSGRLVCRCHDVFLWCYFFFCEMSLFPSISLYHFRFFQVFLCTRVEYVVVRSFLPNAFLHCDHGLDFLHQLICCCCCC